MDHGPRTTDNARFDLRRYLWPAACVAIAFAYVLSTPRVWQCEGVDEFDYLSLAHSLARGYGYTVYGAPHVLYPPLFATLLSVVMRFAGVGAWRVMYGLNALLGISGWILIGTWMRHEFGRIGRMAAWCLLFSYYAWSFPCRFLMSEPLFLPISFGAVILAWRVLNRNRGCVWEYVSFGVLCLAAGATRAAAISLNLALVLAGLTRWLTTRRRAGLALALLALLLGAGFFAYWSARADVVAPNAAESHWRWARKYLGISDETQGIIARGEEVTEISASPWRRVVFWSLRYAQFVTSVVRPTSGLVPLAVLLSLLFFIGLLVHWRRYSWSPLAWYSAVFLTMILMTTWLSNYHRFLLVLAPFLFLFLLDGARATWRALSRLKPFWAGLPFLAFGAWGLMVVLNQAPCDSPSSGVCLYQTTIRVALALVYLGSVFVFLWSIGKGFPVLGTPSDRVLAVVILIFGIHGLTLAGLRYRMTRANATLKHHNLEGAVACGTWIRHNTPPDAKCIATLPQMWSFLSDRIVAKPTFASDGVLVATNVDYVFLSGPLREMPPGYGDWEEAWVRQAVERWVKTGSCKGPIFSAGDAAVYLIGSDPAL